MDVESEGAAAGEGSWPAPEAAGSAVAEGSMEAGAAVSMGLVACKKACVLFHWLKMSLQKLADSH